MGINIKSSQNAYEMHKFVNFRNLTKKTEKKKLQKLSQKVDFSQTYMVFKNDGHTIGISKVPQRIKEQLLTVSK